MDISNMVDIANEMREEALDLLKGLISCETTDYDEENGQTELLKYLSKMNCELHDVIPDPEKLSVYPEFNSGHTYENRRCIVGVFKGTGGGRSLILNAHMDTVFPANPEEWKTDPFTPTEIDGKLYGLGSCDTKGGMAAMLMAVKLLNKAGVSLAGDVIFESVVDEEAGGGNGSLACLNAGYLADAVLIAEPNGLSPTCAQIGSYALKITVEGKSAHGNLKWEGVSAFEKALPLINRLAQLEKVWHERKFDLLKSPVVTVLNIHAGDGSITLPATCEMLVNYTYLPDGYDYNKDINAVIDECTAVDEWFKEHPIHVQLHHNCGPYYTNPAEEWPKLTAECTSAVLGRQIGLNGLPCGSDGRLFANVGKMPTVVLGPGHIENAHKPNEFVIIDDYIKAIALYATIIYKWCGGTKA